MIDIKKFVNIVVTETTAFNEDEIIVSTESNEYQITVTTDSDENEVETNDPTVTFLQTSTESRVGRKQRIETNGPVDGNTLWNSRTTHEIAEENRSQTNTIPNSNWSFNPIGNRNEGIVCKYAIIIARRIIDYALF